MDKVLCFGKCNLGVKKSNKSVFLARQASQSTFKDAYRSVQVKYHAFEEQIEVKSEVLGPKPSQELAVGMYCVFYQLLKLISLFKNPKS